MKKRVLYFITLCLGLFSCCYPEKVSALELNFTVTPSAEYNTKGYFDFQTQPGQKKPLTVKLTNNSDKNIVIVVTKLNALTNNGDISYTAQKQTNNSKLSDQRYLAAQYLHGPRKIPLAARESKDVIYTYQAPDDISKGQVLGGLSFTSASGDDEANYTSSQKSIQITNKVARNIAVVANYQPQKAKLSLGKAKLNNNVATPLIQIEMRNHTTQMGHKFKIGYVLKNNAGKVLSTKKIDPQNSGTPFAPVSQWYQSIPWPLKTYQTGHYKLTVTVTTEQPYQKLNRTYNLQVTHHDVTNYQKASGTKNVAKTNWVLVGAVIILAVLVIVLLGILLKRTHKDK
ncbi:WxL protein peptidoglycan domain-containing protein [Ligilactobacillus equi]|uniref:WxL protein peptidoglycan domain-containing protein n=1 Tax=Ligilactobacillus equi TaxID=137357 RepID=UPI000411F6E2|nr:DUF916 domain-containing protein [Ligilactobacillus equi]